MGNPVVHFEVVGKDAAALQSFYKEAFGWKMEPAGEGYAMAYTGDDAKIAGGVGAAPDGSAGRATFYVEVPDLDATLKKIEDLGGKRLAGPMDVPDGPTIARFADPEGHMIGLVRARAAGE